ncbi:MmcQ/YjbR family DNA-binding protein [Psychrosphaera sp. I2R16]|uniref:MmcQ/YjbR family DNA-binding protein n=1 Tax=unclassified Psychrosphaera TaxID=2641570 RepID=UPI0034CF653A
MQLNKLNTVELMELDQLKTYLINKPETLETFPFGDDVSVYKVKNKMFALLAWRDDQLMLNLKCDPDESIMLREIFPTIKPGYHMNKKHWISIYFEDPIPKGEIERLIDNSFMLVVNKMAKKDQSSILLHL